MKLSDLDYGTTGVYCITNTVNGKKYVGSSKDCRQRLATHKCKSQWNNQPNNPLYLDMQKYGVDNFECELLVVCNAENLQNEEQRCIEKVKPEYNSIRAKRKEKVKPETFTVKKSKAEMKREWYSRMCFYEGRHYTLRQLETLFVRDGIAHATKEACKYLV